MAAHVFLSYVREDAVLVDGLCGILAAAEVPVWRDTASLWPGQDWRLKIRDAIRNDALVFLACFSHHVLNRIKSYQNEELVLAVEEMRLRRPDQSWLIPVRFDDCQIPDFRIGGDLMLSGLQQADLFGPNGRQNADRLVQAIRQIIGPDFGSTASPGPADLIRRRSADPTTGQPEPGERGKYVLNIDRAQGIQLGDGNTQHNSF
jgi:TIR domain-containing protein